MSTGEAELASSTADLPFEKRIENYLAHQFGAEGLLADGATKIVGGGSRETWSVHVQYETAGGIATERDLIIRIDPEVSLLPSNRHVEYAMYQAFAQVPRVPVPEVLFNEDSSSALGNSFFVMEKVSGDSEPALLLSPLYEQGRPQIAREMMEILGNIAKADYRQIGLLDTIAAPQPADIWAIQLDHWEKTLHDHQLGPNPVTEAAIRYLRRQPPPPPPRVTVVHGDYRIGNFLYGPDRIEAVVDWEMAHLGDPHEDLAWAFAQNWRTGANPHLVGGLLERDEAIELWEQTSGLRVDPEALRWWQVFTHVKGNAIWLTGAHTRAVNYSCTAWMFVDKQEMWMLEDMGVVS